MTNFYWLRGLLISMLLCLALAAMPQMPAVMYAILFPGLTLIVLAVSDFLDARLHIGIEWRN